MFTLVCFNVKKNRTDNLAKLSLSFNKGGSRRVLLRSDVLRMFKLTRGQLQDMAERGIVTTYSVRGRVYFDYFSITKQARRK